MYWPDTGEHPAGQTNSLSFATARKQFACARRQPQNLFAIAGIHAEYNDCQDEYPGNKLGNYQSHLFLPPEVAAASAVISCHTSDFLCAELIDEHGGHSPPPILDLNQTKLPGRCRMGQVGIDLPMTECSHYCTPSAIHQE
jgi:hypothetical protein